MNLEKLRGEYKKARPAIKAALEGYKKANDYFYEMCFCLLTPQSSAFKCDACINELKKADFITKKLEPSPIPRKHTRFHNTKAKYLLNLKENYAKIIGGLENSKLSHHKREFLVREVPGLGMKEASHFLRNTGHTGLAILDRHILKNLSLLGVIEMPKTLTYRKYIDIEEKFRKFGETVGIAMDELDLLFWSTETGRVFK